MPGMAQGAHRGRPVAAAPCTPGLRPAKSPLRGAFDLSLQASGRAEAASLQNTALSPHPCGLPRPSGNVSAILRPQHRQFQSHKWVNQRQVARTPGRARREPPPGIKAAPCLRSSPGGAALAGSGSGISRSVSLKNTRRPQTKRPVSIANRPFLSASAKRVSRGAGTPAC
ncbi:hypothetical protein SB5610_04400 [Klebsiella variicola]|nr:hypothetical protein SB5610_04400 [Klebsiella variicola]